jgi:hypothetical protein
MLYCFIFTQQKIYIEFICKLSFYHEGLLPKIIILQKDHSKKILLKTLQVWLHLFKTHLNPGFDHISDAGSSGVHKVAVKTFCAHAYYQYCRYSLTDCAIWGCRIQRLARQIQTFVIKRQFTNKFNIYFLLSKNKAHRKYDQILDLNVF